MIKPIPAKAGTLNTVSRKARAAREFQLAQVVIAILKDAHHITRPPNAKCESASIYIVVIGIEALSAIECH
jgi:hypothetical protein